MIELPKKYQHNTQEVKWQSYWNEHKVYAWDDTAERRDTFVIDTPPPTVSGMLHMGHVFSYAQADFVARYQRMKGKTVFYPMGFDDNGLPTERLVEKVKKVRAVDLSREDFIALCEGVAEEARKAFRQLFETTALSIDWNYEYHTISETSRKISQLSFLDLFHKQRAYRKLQPMLWDPIDQTAIAQAEVEDKEHDSFMNHINFTVAETDESVTIATTRPELLAACVAVFYHPEDARYQHLAGKHALTALFGVKVPLLADSEVKMDKGTGLVMCCTFGDETDIHWWREHQLTTRLIVNHYGKLTHLEAIGKVHPETQEPWESVDVDAAAEIAAQLNGLKVKVAREKTITLLKEKELLLLQEPITHAVKCAERSGAALEIIPTHQWFIKILDQKEALKAKANQCEWHPAFMKVRMEQWIDGLNWDWCVSRQRYFGVPFPIWYSKRAGEEGKILIADADQLPVNPLVDVPKGYTRDEVEAEQDVMDTWATSSVSPQLSSYAITEEYAIDHRRHQQLFPADLRPQAHEIIRTWAFYTVVKAHLHEQTIPWKHVMISGWCLAADKTKMSKSKGNVVTPVGLIEEKGADVVRYWASTSRLGADTAYSEDVMKVGKKLITKLWNATKFAAIHLDKITDTPISAKAEVDSGIIYETLDLWIISRLHKAVAKATEEFERYEYCNARIAVEDFFWNDFCDNYLEMVKARAYDEAQDNPSGQRSAVYTIYHCVETFLRLFAPFVPHITEELYSHIFSAKHQQTISIHARGTWPKIADYICDETAELAGVTAVDVLDAVRKLKASKNVSIKYPLDEVVIGNTEIETLLAPIERDLCKVMNAATIRFSLTPIDPNAEDSCVSDQSLTVSALFAKEADVA